VSEPIRLWKEHDAMAAIVNGVKSPQFTLDRRALEDFAYPDEEYVALPRPEFAALSARVAKLEAALRGTIPFVCTAAIGEFVHPSAKANRDAVMWAIHDLLPGEIRAEGIETPRAALEDKS
jgi:hypothetical protein